MGFWQRLRERRLIYLLRFIWVLVLLWGEVAVFPRAIGRCSWPDGGLNVENTRIMIVADPQILDLWSYPDRPFILRWFSQVMTDMNLRRSWRAMLALEPHTIVFLGDMMDRGRADIPDAEYMAYVKRFEGIFSLDKPRQTLFLPGNHDVGLGPRDSPSPYARERYTSTFGSAPSNVKMANHTLLLIDAPLLADQDSAAEAGAPIPALRRVGNMASSAEGPIILFSHIPLARPAGTDCGPFRERGTIRPGTGRGYQNTLSPSVSKALIETVKPLVVFSGDDHDYCDTSAGGVRDVTVKSMSMAMGIRVPAFQLLTLFPGSVLPNSDVKTYADIPCFLPDQLGIYLRLYIPLIIISLLVLGFSPYAGTTRGHTSSAEKDKHLDILERGIATPLPVPGSSSVSGRIGGVSKFLRSVRDVAWPPVALFIVLAALAFL